MDEARQRMLILPTLITQQCECCGKWKDQQQLVWDLVADRLVCRDCYETNK